MKPVPAVRVGATFVAEPVEPSLRFWLEMLGLGSRVEFAPYNQVFQELLSPDSPAAEVRGANVLLVRPEDWLREQRAPMATPVVDDLAGAAAATGRCRLPIGIEVAELNRPETDHLFREIFQNRAYLRHGIQIPDSAVVVDCGANIGMFSLFAHLHARDVRILAVEPGPSAAAVLRANASLHGMALTVVDAGLSDHDGEATFTSYENYSLVSGFDAAQDEDEAFLRAAIRSTLRADDRNNEEAETVETLTDYLVSERLRQTQVSRPVRRLGRILREHGVDRIDLLKIDVEKAERQVIDGIEPERWPAIQQVVMEIHDRGDAIRSTVEMLERLGFRVAIEEERDLRNTGVWNLFAVRPAYEAALHQAEAARHDEILRNVNDLVGAVRAAAARNPSLFALVVCPPSAAAAARFGHQGLFDQVMRTLRQGTAGCPNLAVVDAHDVGEHYDCPAAYDWKADELGHMPFSAAGYDVLGTVVARAVHAWAKPATKVVVVDCDNTLWSGVCGEDGPAGLSIGPNHRRLHQCLATLQDAGVLLALNSKNAPADVWAVFDQRPDLEIGRDRFVASRLNWLAKSDNLKSIAEELNLGLDSFVFLDDNPVECAEVRAHAPGAVVLQWPTDPVRGVRFLTHAWPFDLGSTTAEDRTRTALYQQESERRQLLDTSTSLEAFLGGLAMDISVTPVQPEAIARAAQLTMRTNQFNFTTIRRSEHDVRELIADGADVRILHLKDRFGDYGFVGLAIAHRDHGRGALAVDTFLMSCRALGKGVEHRLLAALGHLALEAGLESVELPYTPTARNRPAWIFASSVAPAAPADGATAHTFVWSAREASEVVFRPSAARAAADGDAEVDAESRPAAFRPDYQRIADELSTAVGIAAAVHPVSSAAAVSQAGYEPPTTDVERTLALIWADLLHLDRVGIHDNFFAIGGDSIIGIQVLSRAGQAGLALDMKDLFEHETVFSLARAAARRQVVISDDTTASPGTPVALTPIQHWFFEKRLPAPAHWNMEMVARANGAVDAGVLRDSVYALVEHHDALRYRYAPAADEWSQSVGDLDRVESVEVVAVPADPERRHHAMALAAARAHASLDLAQGPLIRTVLCVPDDGSAAQIILVAHHLISDGITWRILLEDLDTAYAQRAAGRPVSLPRSTSYGRWAAQLAAHGADPEAVAELPYWRRVTSEGATPIRRDRPARAAGATERSLVVTPSVFPPDETRVLLQDVPRALDTQVNDVLLAALAVAFRETFGVTSLLVDLEGHGREPLFGGVDLSRTVGWFTTIFPVRLDGSRVNLRDAVAAARAVRLGVPRRGIGYGVLRYLNPDAAVRRSLDSAPQPEVMFNYLGQFDQALQASARFSLSPDVDFGPLHGPEGLRSHLFEIIGRVVGGQLRLDWMYSGALFDTATVERLIASYETALRGILNLVREPAAAGSRGRDAALRDRFGRQEIEGVYGLTPIQQLFLVALQTGQDVGLDQWQCRVEGEVQTAAFAQAWQHCVASHSAMRTAFASDLPGGPAQVVLRDVTPDWLERDLSALPPPAQREEIATYLAGDRRRGFDPLAPPLMRVAMFKVGPNLWEMVWTFHHLVIDGWSCPLVFEAVGAAYDAIMDSRGLPPGGPGYGTYVAWLEEHPARDTEPFWRQYLAGFSEPSVLPRTAGAIDTVAEKTVALSASDTAAVHVMARSWRVSLNTILQLAWALVLSRQTGRSDVVFGVAFSGRPPDLTDVERIVGPFVNNLPVRVRLDGAATLEATARTMQAEQFDLMSRQTSPLSIVQRASEVGPGVRLFESLLVLQSYAAATGLRRLGGRLAVAGVDAPVRTNYPLTVVAVPGTELQLRVVANPGTMSPMHLERLVADFAVAVRACGAAGQSVAMVQAALSAETGATVARRPRVRSAHPVPPRPGLESTLVGIWQRAFGLDDIGVDETFADLGGQSILILQIHAEVQRAVGRSVSIVALFQHPTIRALTTHLQGDQPVGDRAEAVRSRAARQAGALAQRPARRRP